MAFSENAKAVLTFLRDHEGEDFTAPQIAEELGMEPRSVNGTVTGLARKHLACRAEVEGLDRKVIRVTAAGRDVDLDAE